MSTAQNHISKRLAAFLLTLVFMLGCIPAALAVDLSVDAGFYFKQSRGGTCTLTSAAMMLRRRAYLDGLDDWDDVTENSVRRKAWKGGLSHSFTYKEMQVGYATLPSGTKQKTKTLISLLQQHPEGIVLYDRSIPHAVLLTDYTNGTFYCSDPAGSIMDGRIPLSQAKCSLSRASCYWYIISDHNDLSALQGDGLRLDGMSYPVNVHQGTGISLTGRAYSATGKTIAAVDIAVIDMAEQTVISASAAPNTGCWSFQNLDSAVRFGTLQTGTYTYMVMVTDSDGQSLCFASDFTVSDAAAEAASYWSAQDAEGSKLLKQAEKVIGGAVDSAEKSAGKSSGWFKKLLSKLQSKKIDTSAVPEYAEPADETQTTGD